MAASGIVFELRDVEVRIARTLGGPPVLAGAVVRGRIVDEVGAELTPEVAIRLTAEERDRLALVLNRAAGRWLLEVAQRAAAEPAMPLPTPNPPGPPEPPVPPRGRWGGLGRARR
jgi:hypothetical protein